jgi:hypothetical protein
MSTWLLLAPEREDDPALTNSAWIARRTQDAAPNAPIALTGRDAVRHRFEQLVQSQHQIEGVAFFGHGASDRLFDADRMPNDPTGPTAIDTANAALLKGRWVHAFACWSGEQLAARAVLNGASIYVGYKKPLDIGWSAPPPAEAEFVEMVTYVTTALIKGVRDERSLLSQLSAAVDNFIAALEATPKADSSPGWMWLHKLAQDLVDHLVVIVHP